MGHGGFIPARVKLRQIKTKPKIYNENELRSLAPSVSTKATWVWSRIWLRRGYQICGIKEASDRS
jgi:hypothetical protein